MNLVKTTAATLLAYGGANWFWKAVTGVRRRPLVVAYHRVLSGGERFIDGTQNYTTASEFEKQIEYLLKTRKWVALSELVPGENGTAPTFAVTFDDGYADTYRVAFPILRKLGVTTTAL